MSVTLPFLCLAHDVAEFITFQNWRCLLHLRSSLVVGHALPRTALLARRHAFLYCFRADL